MEESNNKFEYPLDIKLERNSLVEAWLEIQWQYQSTSMDESVGSSFTFALGKIRELVSNDFPIHESTNAVNVPEQVAPHTIRYKFRPEQQGWPILQFGPMVATVNYDSSVYKGWTEFKQSAVSLRDILLDAYKEEDIVCNNIILRFRNVEPMSYSKTDILDWVDHHLNTRIQLPPTIPGSTAQSGLPTALNATFEYDIREPIGKASLLLSSGTRATRQEGDDEEPEEIVLWQLAMASEGNDVPNLYDKVEYYNWLDAAHRILHEWYFSLIDGVLMAKYEGR